MVSRSARRREQRDLAMALRDGGADPPEIAATLRDRYGLNARVAMRTAHGWTQAEVAQRWTTRWPDDPRTFKSISYWENWPSPTGHAPSLGVLDRLALLYKCDVADLIVGWGEHRSAPGDRSGAGPAALAWQVDHLDLPELSRAMAEWSQRLPQDQRRALLLKLSSASAVAAGRSTTLPAIAAGRGPAISELAGRWASRYSYFSTGRNADLEGRHAVHLKPVRGRLVGRSEPTDTGTVELDLAADGLLITGSWTERTEPTGYYRGAVYHGVVQLVLDPTGRSMTGRWLGPDRNFRIDSGGWELTRN